MTVCIASMSRQLGIIVGVSDTKLTAAYDWNSADAATMKTFPIRHAPRWRGMYAGNPSECEELLRHIDTILAKSIDVTDDAIRLTVDAPEMVAAVEGAYAATRAHKIEATILSTFRMTHERFLTEGREIFGDEYFGNLLAETRAVVLGTQLLIYGLGPRGRAYIFESSADYGVCTSYEQIGFHAIGSGAGAASAVLYSTKDCRDKETESEAIYRTCEALFAARAASGVGGLATVTVLHNKRPDPDVFFVGEEGCPITAAWEQRRKQAIDAESLREIEARLANCRPMFPKLELETGDD